MAYHDKEYTNMYSLRITRRQWVRLHKFATKHKVNKADVIREAIDNL